MTRAAVVGAMLLAVIALRGPAAADIVKMGPNPIPTNTPIIALASPPLSVAAPSAIDACANDDFQAWRSVPTPVGHEVTVCGSVSNVAPTVPSGKSGPSFYLDADGTPTVTVFTNGPIGAQPGNTVVVRGRYVRASSGAEWIDQTTNVVSRSWSLPGYVILNGMTHN